LDLAAPSGAIELLGGDGDMARFVKRHRKRRTSRYRRLLRGVGRHRSCFNLRRAMFHRHYKYAIRERVERRAISIPG
jgi:hypothetical protein